MSGIALFPALEADPKRKEDCMKVIELRDAVDYQCYMQLRELLETLFLPDTKEQIAKALDLDLEEVEDVIDTANEAIERRDVANNLFLAIVSGQSSNMAVLES